MLLNCVCRTHPGRLADYPKSLIDYQNNLTGIAVKIQENRFSVQLLLEAPKAAAFRKSGLLMQPFGAFQVLSEPSKPLLSPFQVTSESLNTKTVAGSVVIL